MVAVERRMSRPLVSRFMGASPWEEVYGNTYIPGRIERRCECTWRGSTNETRTPAGNFHFYTEPPLYDLPRGCERANRVRALTGVSAFSFYSLLFEREGERERERYAYFVGGRTIRGIVPLSECSQSSRAPSRGDESSLSVFLCSEEEDDNGFEAFR